MKFQALSLAGFAVIAFVAPALAHHSFAMFDAEKTLTMQGTVKELEWTNPHSWLRVMVDDKTTGKPAQWAIEMGAPAQQVRVGWKPDSVRPGDKVTVTIHPLKDGSRGGQFITAILPNGTVLGDGGRRPSATGE
ncbi:MAG TPA: DUF6152 family protein [Micropepsaceae bacterium]|nr:DUF6152 family protein [Micropepsaceae bacterium]